MKQFLNANKSALTDLVNITHHIDLSMDDLMISIYAKSAGTSLIKLSENGTNILSFDMFVDDEITIVNNLDSRAFTLNLAGNKLNKTEWVDLEISENVWCDLVEEVLDYIIINADLTAPIVAPKASKDNKINTIKNKIKCRTRSVNFISLKMEK